MVLSRGAHSIPGRAGDTIPKHASPKHWKNRHPRALSALGQQRPRSHLRVEGMPLGGETETPGAAGLWGVAIIDSGLEDTPVEQLPAPAPGLRRPARLGHQPGLGASPMKVNREQHQLIEARGPVLTIATAHLPVDALAQGSDPPPAPIANHDGEPLPVPRDRGGAGQGLAGDGDAQRLFLPPAARQSGGRRQYQLLAPGLRLEPRGWRGGQCRHADQGRGAEGHPSFSLATPWGTWPVATWGLADSQCCCWSSKNTSAP